MKPTFIKVCAVLSSLALATSFVWYQSRGKTRMMSGSKSSAASAAATSYVEADAVYSRTTYNASGELEIKPQALAPSSAATRSFTVEEEAAIRKELIFSSKSGKIFEPTDAPPAQSFQIHPVLTNPDTKEATRDDALKHVGPPRQEPERKVLMFSSKDGAVFQPNDVPTASAPQRTARPAQSGNSAQPAPVPRRTIMPGSKTLIIDDMPIEFTPQPQPKPAPRPTQAPEGKPQQQQQTQPRRVLLPSSKSGGFRE